MQIPDPRDAVKSPFATSARPAASAPEPAPRAYRVALIGFGTVGRSVARILCERALPGLRLTHVCNRNVERKKVAWMPADVRWTENVADVLASDADIVVEVVGGLDPAEQWVRNALESGKSVVTANKQLIARSGAELQELARARGVHLYYGASVAGGIPVLSGLHEGLAGDQLQKVYGILNGTCNYILSKVESAGISFDTALKEAQDAGFAEADPTDDVEGYDARAKLAILAREGLATRVHPEDIVCGSIRDIDAVDFTYAHQLNATIRQISRAEVHGKRLYASVGPALVPLESPLARVSGSQNLVMATGAYGGETVFSGYGAGGNPTAVAVVSDLLAIAQRRPEYNSYAEIPTVARKVSADFTSPHYVRFTVNDRPGIIAVLATIFGKNGINIDSVLQKTGFAKDRLAFVITLEACSAAAMNRAMEEIAALDFHVIPPVNLPILS
ncbi:MAG: homoserine dehydrogenase [Terriglobales bacterium]